MRIQNGKFWEDGKEVKPEFGNLKQIALLKQFEELHKLFASEKGVIVEGEMIEVEDWYSEDDVAIQFKYVIEWECTCGNLLEHKISDCDEFEVGTDLFDVYGIHKCDCGKNYKLTPIYDDEIRITYYE